MIVWAIWIVLFATMIVAAIIETWRLFIIATVSWIGMSFIIRMIWESANKD